MSDRRYTCERLAFAQRPNFATSFEPLLGVLHLACALELGYAC